MLKIRQLFCVVRWCAHLEMVGTISCFCCSVNHGHSTSGSSRRVLNRPPNSQVNW